MPVQNVSRDELANSSPLGNAGARNAYLPSQKNSTIQSARILARGIVRKFVAGH